MDETRQSPEQILKQIEKEEQTLNRGHLKIFFGYAAGVGKTYAMLKAAHSAKRRGIDVVAGYIEPHARPQTSALVNGLECLPNLVSEYNGITLSEFNLDAALAMNHTEEGDDEAYVKAWFDFIADWNDELPEIPLYSNDYHDFFTSKLHDFEEDGYNWDATNAILYANME